MLILFFFCVSILSLFILILSIYRKFKKKEQQVSNFTSESRLLDESRQTHYESDLTHLPRSLLLEILPSDSPEWATLFSGEGEPDPVGNGSGEEFGRKKRKKRGKKKRPSSPELTAKDCGGGGGGGKEKEELVCLYPFTSSSSATQRRIKQQYDQLVKSHESSGLTMAQVGQFVNCLIKARNELQHKSEVIQRKFTITKALIFKADRSSFERLRQQIYKLELEQKRLEEDAFVFNWLQQQLKLSPAYKKMLEIGARVELEAKSDELMESEDAGFAEISFEELLAQEKKDSFWQRNGKPKLCSGR
ncbi:hypothetical protein RJ640_008489 [Escallonia rubra]|uniref:AT1G17665-like protein n=1 Tax=Escallonia rubra TaxID=112253 RepID=A0AA88RCT1_9ASTE|nr:hypothetical protein RJ640_008489 [Escallonia rubra]